MQRFDENPILNSPYLMPESHWHLDKQGRPTGTIGSGRRTSIHLVPVPKARLERARTAKQAEIIAEEEQKDHPIVNEIRKLVDIWRASPPEKWNVSNETKELLRHWREGKTNPRLFFCQLEAAETLIWLNEIAPHTAAGRRLLAEIKEANAEANPGLLRFAAKMATGSGKTMVMAMMIAYHTINKARQPKSQRFCKNFLIVTPGITIKDRLRVLLPSDPSNYYVGHGIIPSDFVKDIKQASIVITNFHAFRQNEKRNLPKSVREVLKGNDDEDISTLETEGQMLERVCKELLGSKEAIVINDEAHHCYRHKVVSGEQSGNGGAIDNLTGEDRAEAKKNNETGRIWIRGIEALGRKIGVRAAYDLSATPYFLNGSGYKEGHLFPWVVSDFALMDAIECGIVKLPRVPIDDSSVTADNLPIFRNIYKHVRKDLPRKGRTAQGKVCPASHPLPAQLVAGLSALYEHYAKTHAAWAKQEIDIPPVFVVVCNNTSTSKLVHDYVAGYELPKRPGTWRRGELKLFSNIGDDGKPLARMHTLLIDSEQLDSGEAMSAEFRQAAAAEIELYKQEMRLRFPDRDVSKLTDENLLREIMNTVGKIDRLGEQIRCVISVSMLTEGWDTNNVTHILGVRAFGTQLLCEQVVGRGLRRYSHQLEEEGEHAGRFRPEYADVFGVPFTFAFGSKGGKQDPPPPQYRVRAIDERSHLAITYPRVRGYTVRMPEEKLIAKFDANSRLTLTPEDAPPVTEQKGIVGKGITLTFEELKKRRMNEVVFALAYEVTKKFADEEGSIPPCRFRDLVPITRRWLADYLTCLGGTVPQYLLWQIHAVKAAERIFRACIKVERSKEVVLPLIDMFTPEGSSFYVDFLTRKKRRFTTRADKCHVNIAVCDSDWEINFCQLLEENEAVLAYVRNDHLGFEVPYEYQKKEHLYLPDFIALVDDGSGKSDLLNLVVEIKGLRDDQASVKADTMNRVWIPAVNNDVRWGRWAFEEILDPQHAREQLAKHAVGGKVSSPV